MDLIFEFAYIITGDLFAKADNKLFKILGRNQFDQSTTDKILQLLTNISKKAYSFLEKILDELNYDTTQKLQFPN